MLVKNDYWKDWEQISEPTNTNDYPFMTMHYFDHKGKHKTCSSRALNGANMIHKTTGMIITNYGPMPNNPLYGCDFYKDEESLMNSLCPEI